MHEQSHPVLSAHTLQSNSMPCPCCGNPHEVTATECAACGARPVGPPLAKPDILLPKLGPAMLAVGMVCLVVIGFLLVWLMANQMLVGRALLVMLVGDSFEFTKELLNGDNHLPNYRIFAWDMYRLTFYLSVAVLPLTLLGVRAAMRAIKLAKTLPAQFGGLRTAQVSLALSALLFVVFSVAGFSSIPERLQHRREAYEATSRVLMYEHAEALKHYYYEFGTFPSEAADLARLGLTNVPRADIWEQEFKYAPFGTVASARGTAAGALSFSNFTLTSAGPDGEFGTADDIVMIDGVVVDKPSDTDVPKSVLTPEQKPRR